MKIALPVHEGRVSPLLDTATQVLLVELREGSVVSRVRLLLPAAHIFGRIDALVEIGAEALVCGAISESSLRYLLARGLGVWPGVAGEAEAVIASLARHGVLEASLRMPGSAAPANGPQGAGCARPWAWIPAESRPTVEKENEDAPEETERPHAAWTSRKE